MVRAFLTLALKHGAAIYATCTALLSSQGRHEALGASYENSERTAQQNTVVEPRLALQKFGMVRSAVRKGEGIFGDCAIEPCSPKVKECIRCASYQWLINGLAPR